MDPELEKLLSMAPERIAERRVRAEDLEGPSKRRKTKEERMASVLEGREGRDGFGASSGRRKKKTGEWMAVMGVRRKKKMGEWML